MPTTGEDNCFYLVPAKNEADQDIYEEYLWLESKFEKLGSTDIKIENYYTKNEISEIVEKVTSEVSAEATSRVTADDGLQAKIEQEITDRATNDQDIIDSLNTFKTEATDSFTDVNSAISSEVNDRKAGISDLESKLAAKQDILVSGTTVKTINGESILGTGDIDTAKDMVAVIIRRY